jgi:ornithine cyclodeaminase/alanine dehydrogenase-like protein (mu-crystallin family)
VTELATVLAGVWKAPAEPGITLFEAHGLALWDLAAASVVLPKAIEQGLGEEIALF